MISFLSKGFFFFPGWSNPQWPKLHPAMCHRVSLVLSALLAHVLRNLIRVRAMIRKEDEERSEDRFIVFLFGIILPSLLQLRQIQIESLSKGITHAYIRSEFGLIGTRHFLGTISRQRFWESNYSSRMSVPKTETASFWATILGRSLMLICIIPLWRRNSFSYKDVFVILEKCCKKGLTPKSLVYHLDELISHC